MNTRQYSYLLTIASYGCLSHAAKKLNISQAALSKFLNEQERLLGVKLFLRYKKRLYPTPAGRLYLDAAQRILTVKNSTVQTINRLTRIASAPIRVASTPYRGAELFSRVYSRFSNIFPTVDLTLEEIYSSQQEEQIHNGSIDFAFGVNLHTRYADVYNLPVSSEELVLAVPSFHPLAKYAGPSIKRLVSMPIQAFKDTPFVLPSRKNNIRIVADDLFKKAGFSPVIAFESSNGMTVDAMIRRGAGVGLISHRYVKPEPELVYFRLDPPCYEISYIRYASNRQLTDVERYLLGIVVEERLKTPGHKLIPSPEIQSFQKELSRNVQSGGI